MATPASPAAVQVASVLAEAPDVQTGHRQFSLRNAQIVDEADGRRFNLTFGPHPRDNYFSPRHRHNFDQVRLIVSGRAKYGPLRMDTHDVAYFPEGVFYGPAEILSDEATTCVIQTQGASWSRFMTLQEQAAASELAGQLGEFDVARGLFQRPDGRRQDSYEALLETTQGRPVQYPEPRFLHPVLLRSDRFAWRVVADQPGVRAKRLAQFGGGPSLAWLSVDAGVRAELSPIARHRLFTVVGGSVSVAGGDGLEPGTFIHFPPDRPASLRAGRDALLLGCEFEPRTPPDLAL